MRQNHGFQLKVTVMGLCIVLIAASCSGFVTEQKGKVINDSSHQIFLSSVGENRVEKSTGEGNIAGGEGLVSGESIPVGSEGGYIQNEILVKFRSGSNIPSSSKEMTALLNQKAKGKLSFVPIVSINPVFSDRGETRVGLERWFQLKVVMGNGDLRDEIMKYSDPVFQEVFEYVQPSYMHRISLVPDDPFYSSSGSWGQDYPDLWGIQKIRSADAWNFSTGFDDVVVAVVDTGVDYNHPDLAANMWTDGNGHHGFDYVNNDFDPMDDSGHGTHCAGTIAAVGNNAVGVVGVNWHCKIMAVKCLDNNGGAGPATLAQGIRWAADHGADVISNSWGPTDRTPSDPVVEDAVRYAYYEKGCVVVFAAGNSNDDVQYYCPANMDEVIAVAATNYTDKKASFSNYGELIDVAAPGVNVLSTFPTDISQPFYLGVVTVHSDDDTRLQGIMMLYSPIPPSAGVSGQVLSAGYGYPEDFEGQDFAGKIALMQRGPPGFKFKDKVQNAYNAGAVGAIIYNNVPGGPVPGSLIEQAMIPALMISDVDGLYLYQLIQNEPTFATITAELWEYAILDGTSMACPHVAGLAALILSLYPEYSNDEVAERIRYSADNIDDLNPGYEDLLGSGRINAFRAVKNLDHDVGIFSVQDLPGHIQSRAALPIYATLINDGKTDEINVNVILRSNGIPVDSLTLSVFPHKSFQDITLFFTPPTVGVYTLTLNTSISGFPDEYPVDNDYNVKTLIAGVLNVDTGELFNTIQEAHDDNDTWDGHHLLVPPGLYRENLLITKNINQMGMDKNTTVIDGCGDVTISLEGTSTVTLNGFSVINGTIGIKVSEATHTVIQDLIIKNQSNTGVMLVATTDTLLTQNHILSNTLGVQIDDTCIGTLVNHNNFNNTENAVDTSSGTQWDNGYPAGGNHWSDYYGGDDWSGAGQNEPGPDGIGDTPYNISMEHGIQDRYPLTYPFEVLVVNYHTDEFFSSIQTAINDDDTITGHLLLVRSHLYQEHVTVTKGVMLQGQDPLTTILDGSSKGSVMTITSGGATVTGFTAQNSGSTYGAGIIVQSASSCTIKGNIVTNNNYGITVSNSPGTLITQNTFTGTNIQGLLLDSSPSATITENTFDHTGITIHGTVLNQWNTHTIVNNNVNGKPIRYYVNANDIEVPSDTGQAILANCHNGVIQNLFIAEKDPGIQLGFSSYIMLQGNTITGSINDMSITLFQSSNNTIRGTTLIDSSGISLDNCQYNIIIHTTDADIENNGCLYGMYLSYSDHNTISQNTISNKENGIYLFASSVNTISKNFIYNNTYGINLVADIFVPLMRSGSSENNVIFENTFESNEIGINFNGYSYDNKNNRFYHNNFFYNIEQALTYGDNIWCNETTWQGNYWSDYIDLYPAIDDNFDGIWDYAYEVSGDPIGYDWCPLVHPYIPGDMNHDQVVNFDDINPFNLSINDPWEYQIEYQMLASLHGDLDGDGEANVGDINLFVQLMNEMVSDRPNTPLMPQGTVCGIIGNEYTYSASTLDPNGDYIQYGWGWDGDDFVDSWTSFVPSGTETSIPCWWYDRGTYEVKVKAKDPWFFESDWSASLQVRIVILGDMNDDGIVDFGDINPFVLALTNPAEYSNRFPGLDLNVVGDINQDGVCDFGDINPFVMLLIGG